MIIRLIIKKYYILNILNGNYISRFFVGAGLLFNNKQETSREKVTTNIPNNKNIYETNFNKLEHNDKQRRKVRFTDALQNKDGIIDSNLYKKQNIDPYVEKHTATYDET